MTERDRELLELAQDNEAYFLMSRRDRQRVRELEKEQEIENDYWKESTLDLQ